MLRFILDNQIDFVIVLVFSQVSHFFRLLIQKTAEVMWEGREEPLVFLDSLKEAHLFYLEGMKNG